MDKYGYLNSCDFDSSSYVLALGSSHTQGKEVLNGLRYSDLLNSFIGDNSSKCFVYNVSQDAYLFDKIAKNFKAVIGHYPKSQSIIIEIMMTNISSEHLINALNQQAYISSNQLNNISIDKKIKNTVKEFFPIFSLFGTQIDAITNKSSIPTNSKEIDLNEYENTLDSLIKLIRSEYEHQILIVYHPQIEISNEGITIKNEETTSTFEKVCQKNGIDFLNMAESFERAYQKDFSVPYGFANSTIGEGHLNKYGHRLMAEEIYKILDLRRGVK